jgi:RNA polymerase sigma factor (sigma-70 family)
MPQLEEMPDTDITHPSFLLRLRDRTDRLGWPEFHSKYGHMLYRYARALGAAHIDAEDVVQDVEMQLFQAIEGFVYDARRGRFRAYLRSSVQHALSRRAQRRARRPAALDPHKLDTLLPAESPAQNDAWEQEWQLHRLRWATAAIAAEFEPLALKAFEMHVLAAVPVEETARQLGISKWRVYRARNRVLERLREKLAELDPEEDF